MTKPFTVETFNGHDNTMPIKSATFIGLQERGGVWASPGMTMWYPAGLQEAIGWDKERFEIEDKGKTFLHHDGRYYCHRLTTPERWALWIKGLLDGHKVAVIDTHLVNNAWGLSIRGERRLRRRLWRKGWKIVRQLRHDLEREGYAVFIVGDLNRVLRFWETAQRVVGAGFDRIFYPPEVDQLEAWYGDDNGSDHRPLFATFRFKAGPR
jgi:hypothetical protein